MALAFTGCTSMANDPTGPDEPEILSFAVNTTPTDASVDIIDTKTGMPIFSGTSPIVGFIAPDTGVLLIRSMMDGYKVANTVRTIHYNHPADDVNETLIEILEEPEAPTAEIVSAPDEVDSNTDFTLRVRSENGNVGFFFGCTNREPPAPVNGEFDITCRLESSYTVTYAVFGATPMPALAFKTIKVRGTPPPEPPIAGLIAERLEIMRGEQARLTASCTNGNYGIISPLGEYVPTGNGPVTDRPEHDRTYQHTCVGPGGVSQSGAVTVKVIQPEISGTISADPDSISQGQETKITWTCQNADRIIIDKFGEVTCNGDRFDKPMMTNTYRIEWWLDGEVKTQDSVTVVVTEPQVETAKDSVFYGISGIYILDYGDKQQRELGSFALPTNIVRDSAVVVRAFIRLSYDEQEDEAFALCQILPDGSIECILQPGESCPVVEDDDSSLGEGVVTVGQFQLRDGQTTVRILAQHAILHNCYTPVDGFRTANSVHFLGIWFVYWVYLI
jgi:hypothetical protein